MSPPRASTTSPKTGGACPSCVALASLGRAIWGGYISGSMIRVDGRCIRGIV